MNASHATVAPLSDATVNASHATVAPLSDATVNASHATVAPLSDATVNASHATVNASHATVNEKTPRVMQQLHTNLHIEPSIEPSFNLLFDEFWKLYPKRKSKGDALKAWKKLKPDDHQTIICHLKSRAGKDNQWLKDKGKFIPYPATFLNRCGWLDEWQEGVSPVSETTQKTVRNLEGVVFS